MRFGKTDIMPVGAVFSQRVSPKQNELHMGRSQICIFLLLVLAIGHQSSGSEEEASASAQRTLVVFCAMGDVPYAPREDALLPRQIANLPGDTEFVVHVGNIKDGSTPCSQAVCIKVAGMLATSKTPVFIIPGDNEWNDCARPSEAWEFWKRHFARFDMRWKHRFGVERQTVRDENFSFVREGVLFVGINLVGGRVHDATEWKRRHEQNLEWIRAQTRRAADSTSSMVVFGHAHPNINHKSFFDEFAKDAVKFARPILYLHGDGHRWLRDRPFVAKNILRIQVDQGGIAPPLKVTVTNHATEPFVFDRRKNEK
ncbi:MAG: hypothetical protein VB853_15810 [Pirellulales bacterium]